jgi:hypothetical protein
MIINYKVKLDFEDKQVEVADTTFAPVDSMATDSLATPAIVSIKKTIENIQIPKFMPDWVQLYNDKITPLLKRLKKRNVSLYHFWWLVNRTN